MLELRNITKRFGNVLANDRVNIVIKSGTIHAIVGENGAGKSTAMRIAYGFYRPDGGEILVAGEPREIHSPHDAIALGIGMVHQHFMLVDTMTVAENIILGAEPGGVASVDFYNAEKRIVALAKELRFPLDPRAMIESLSVGQQQRVELMKVLYRDARILILDEPTAVLTPQEVNDLFQTLRQMKEQGKTVIIITHKLDEVLALSDEVTVMRDGRVVGHRDTANTNAAELARLMVGRDVLLRVQKTAAKPGRAVLTTKNLSVITREGARRVDSVSIDVRAGEIVGVAGVEGNGQTELIEALAGLVEHAEAAGEIRLDGQNVMPLSARHRKEMGVGHVPEDRHRRGLLLDSSLAENSILGVHYRQPAVARPGGVLLNKNGIHSRALEVIQKFDVRPPDAELPARALSGGNQQKLIIGREFELPPTVLLVSQPTRGVDIGAIEFIHRKLIELRDAGCAVLLVSAELEEVTALADRLIVMYQGRIVGEVDPTRASKEEIGLMMTGGSR